MKGTPPPKKKKKIFKKLNQTLCLPREPGPVRLGGSARSPAAGRGHGRCLSGNCRVRSAHARFLLPASRGGSPRWLPLPLRPPGRAPGASRGPGAEQERHPADGPVGAACLQPNWSGLLDPETTPRRSAALPCGLVANAGGGEEAVIRGRKDGHHESNTAGDAGAWPCAGRAAGAWEAQCCPRAADLAERCQRG